MRVAVVGVGYVGLSTAVCMATKYPTVAIDINDARIANLNAGKVPIHEKGLEGLLRNGLSSKRLSFQSDPKEIDQSDVIFVAVGTPSAADGSIELSQIRSSCESIGRAIRRSKSMPLVLLKSTVVPGTARDVVKPLLEKGSAKTCGKDFGLCSNPEFLREGSAIQDTLSPDRVVLGPFDEPSLHLARSFYQGFYGRGFSAFLQTSPEGAELVKYGSNSLLATKVSFINLISRLCERFPGTDVEDVARGIGMDPRIGRHFLQAGPGFGGSCFESNETVAVLNSPQVVIERFDSLFEKSGSPTKKGSVDVVRPAQMKVLAFDLNSAKPAIAEVKAMTRRQFQGQMITITTSMGRSLRVTSDHPVVVAGDAGFKILAADSVLPGDRLMLLSELPNLNQNSSLNSIELLRGTSLEDDVLVSPKDDSFRRLYDSYSRAIPRNLVKYKEDIKRGNKMSLSIYNRLVGLGVMKVPNDILRLYTAKGAATKLNAVIPIDDDFARLCGYYIAEGWISLDRGRGKSVRQRVCFTFNEEETEYVTDLQRILKGLGLKFIEKRKTHAITTTVSSRVLAWLLRDVLGCGTRSEDKRLPKFAFNVSRKLRFQLVRGAFSGDGNPSTVQHGRNIMLEYGTVSKSLAQELAFLLQTLGIIASIQVRWMNKSKQWAHILRVNGYGQVAVLREVFGAKHSRRIDTILAGYQRHIAPHGYKRCGPYTTVLARRVEREQVDTTVYSMETSLGTLITSSGVISHNCFPKDVRAFSKTIRDAGVDGSVLQGVLEINEAQPGHVAELAERAAGSLRGKEIAVLGLAFKAGTDDVRESRSIPLIRRLLEKGGNVRAYDPVAMPASKAVLDPRVACASSARSCIEGADVAIVMTAWPQFKSLKPADYHKLMRSPVLVDARRIYDPPSYARKLKYVAVGLGAEVSPA